MLSKPSEESFQPRLCSELRLPSLQARWMTTSRPCAREIRAEGVRGQHGVARRVVGDGEHVDAGALAEREGMAQHALAREVGDDPAACDELDRYEEPVGLLQEMMKGGLAPDIGHELLTGCRSRAHLAATTWKIGRK